MSPATPTIKNWIVCRCGFLQKRGHVGGVVRLAAELHKRFADSDTKVVLQAWDDSPSDTAEMIYRLTPDSCYQIVLIGYSWGGANSLEVARQLQNRGRGVASMVLSDPVYRSFWAWRALLPNPVLTVPKNVKRVVSFRQKRGLLVPDNEALFGYSVNPMGHRLVREYGSQCNEQINHMQHESFLTHAYMDDLDAFHKVAKEECELAIEGDGKIPIDGGWRGGFVD